MELHFYSQILIQQFEERVNKHLKYYSAFHLYYFRLLYHHYLSSHHVTNVQFDSNN